MSLKSTEPEGRKRNLGKHGRLLIGVLLASLGVFVVSQLLPDLADGAADWARLEAEDRVPTREDALGYLIGKSIQIIDPTGHDPTTFAVILKKDQMERFTIKHEDNFYTSAIFDLKTDHGRYTCEVSINHTPIEGRFLFRNFDLLNASKQ